MKEHIFREYDIRGVVTEDFPQELVTDLGRAFGTWIVRRGDSAVGLSGDIRLTTPMLMDWWREGLLSTGIEVIEMGLLPTGANYYSLHHLPIQAAVQITGSHNPPEFNGFKLTHASGAVYGVEIQKLKELIKQGDFEQGAGKHSHYDLLTPYKEMLVSKISLERPLKVAMDCGNAAACLAAPEVFEALGIEITRLFCDADGTFPNHHPDPTELKNLADLISTVQAGDFDFGIAYDGDADRVGVVDETGAVIFADTLMAIFLEEVARPGEPVIFDVKCSQALEEEIERHGAVPKMWKTGHSLIKQKMREMNISFGGEMSGHIFFADEFYGFDDAIYNSLRLARLLSRTAEPLSVLKARIPQYYSTPELRMECLNDDEKFKIAEAAKAYFMANYDCIDIDGVRIRFGDGWGLVRASNTQPVIVSRFEARTAERLAEIRHLVESKISEFGEIKLPE